MFEPLSDDGASLLDGGEPFRVQRFMADRLVEPFVVAVFPGAAWVDLNSFYADFLSHARKL